MNIKLNDYARKENERVHAFLSSQPPMSYEQCVAQVKKLAASSKRKLPEKPKG